MDLEQRFWLTTAQKEDAIRALGLPCAPYYQLINRIVATESALAYAAVTVNRLRLISSSELPVSR